MLPTLDMGTVITKAKEIKYQLVYQFGVSIIHQTKATQLITGGAQISTF